MAIQYEQYLPYDADTGDRPTINGVKWDCVIPCVVVGRTIKGDMPVLRGPNGAPKLNSGELLRTGTLRTRGKPGMTPVEVVTLGEYQRISVKHMVGSTICYAQSDSYSLLLIDDKKNFVKMGVAEDYDGWEMEPARLTMGDLRGFGLVDDDVWAAHEAQQKQATVDRVKGDGKRLLSRAIESLGVEEAKRIIDAKPREREFQIRTKKERPV